MVERLYDEELRKREERRAARAMEREQELAKQAPFAPRVRNSAGTRRPSSTGGKSEVHERHLILYDKHLEMAQKRHKLQQQKLRDEQEYMELHSVHRCASSPRSPQAPDAAVYQRLHEEAELKRQRLEMREKANQKTPTSPTRASSMTSLRLFHMASEVAERRQKLQEQKMKEERDYLQLHSIHRAKADPALISQRLHEEADLKKQRLQDRQREKNEKESQLYAGHRGKVKDPQAVVQRLMCPPSRKKTLAEVREEEERWLRERQVRRPVPRRAVSHGPFTFKRLEPGNSPKAITENEAARVPHSEQVTTFPDFLGTAEELVPANAPSSLPAMAADMAAPLEAALEVTPRSVPFSPEDIKVFCQSTEVLVSAPVQVSEKTGHLAETEADPTDPTPTDPTEPVGPVSVPTAEQIKAFCESTSALVNSSMEIQEPEPKGTDRSRLSLELDECY